MVVRRPTLGSTGKASQRSDLSRLQKEENESQHDPKEEFSRREEQEAQ